MFTVQIDIENERGQLKTWAINEAMGVAWCFDSATDALLKLEDMGETVCWIECQGRQWSCLFAADAVAGAVSR